ncbi:MAG TPA: efflux RND transporter periplasmic adaptor subunit [Gammaproteobacteria bacterium]
MTRSQSAISRSPIALQLALAMLVLLAVALAGCSRANGKNANNDGENQPVAIPVEVAGPLVGDMEAVYTGTAAITADRTVIVMPKVRGEVRAVLAEEGDRVKAGQVLAQLDGDLLRLEAAQAEANLRKLEREYERTVELQKRGLVSVTAFDSLKYELDMARATYDLARLQLSYTALRSPIDGVVVARSPVMRVGNTVTPIGGVIESADSAMFVVSNFDSLVLNVNVPEGELPKLRAGQPAQLVADAVPGRRFDARIGLITPRVDPETGTFPVKIEIDDPDQFLRPGMFARVSIVYQRKADALKIPRSALLETDGPPAVFVVVDGKAEQREVELGLLNGSYVEVLTGLGPQDQIVVIGQAGLKNGTTVKIVNTEQAQAPAAG